MDTNLKWFLGIIVVLMATWILFGDKIKSSFSQKTSSPNAGLSNTNQSGESQYTSTQVRKNEKGTLSLVTIKNGQVISSRELSFDEAVKLVGNVRQVCTGYFGTGAAYAECATVRAR